MKNSLNSMVLYNFQKFQTHDFIQAHKNPPPTLISRLPLTSPHWPLTRLKSVSVDLPLIFIHS